MLAEHDAKDKTVFHQAMILTQSINSLNSADSFVNVYNADEQSAKQRCHRYVGGTSRQVLQILLTLRQVLQDFIDKKFRTLVVVQKLLEVRTCLMMF